VKVVIDKGCAYILVGMGAHIFARALVLLGYRSYNRLNTHIRQTNAHKIRITLINSSERSYSTNDRS